MHDPNEVPADAPFNDPKRGLLDMATLLERKAALALHQGRDKVAAAFAQAAALYRCADELGDIRVTLESWPHPNA